MRWAIFGEKGMLGAEFAKLLADKGEQYIGLSRSNFDLAQTSDELANQISDIDAVVNAIAFTKVDQAETDVTEAYRVNAFFAESLAMACAKTGSRLFHISTDYVFDGQQTKAYRVSDVAEPSTVYGKSKKLGEDLVVASGANYSIFRTAWLYGAHGDCFPRKVAKKLITQDRIEVVDDQFGSPTWTKDLASLIYEHASSGIEEAFVHAVSSGNTSWFEFAKEVAEVLPQKKNSVFPVTSEKYNTPAQRPKFSILDNSETEGPVIGNWLERWNIAKQEVLEDLTSNQIT